MTNLGGTFEVCRAACFGSSGLELEEMNRPGNNLVTQSFAPVSVREAIKDGAKKAKFVAFPDAAKNLKPVNHGFKCQDCLEGSLPALALFLQRDPHTFASMSLDSNHRTVNPMNFLQGKDDKPPIVDAIRISGNKSFQTSGLVIDFCMPAEINKRDTTQPCLQLIGRFDYEAPGSARKLPSRLLVFAPHQPDSQKPCNFF